MVSSINCPKSILIIAAEDSSVLYAERLLELWKSEKRDIKSFGIGSRKMGQLGFEVLGQAEELAVVGFMEVLSQWSKFKKVFHSVLDEVDKSKPQVALLLDYPGFNLRLAEELKKRNIPVVYYISPQVWAWKKGRIKNIKRCVDQVLTIFPFETEFYKKYDVPVNFVGHPLLDEVKKELLVKEDLEQLKQSKGISLEHKILGLMPGSRKSEIKYNLAVQLKTAVKLKEKDSDLQVVLLAAPSLDESWLADKMDELSIEIKIIKDTPFKMIQMMDVILCASGTTTLMVGLMEKPMVIMYRLNPVTAFLAKRLVKSIPFFGMVNLIMGREVAPERFQEKANALELAKLLSVYLDDSKKYREKSEELSVLKGLLQGGGEIQSSINQATINVSKSLDRYW